MWRDEAYLLDMLLAAREIRQFVEGETKEHFSGNRMLQLALMRLIQTIGEAARRVSPEFQDNHLEIPWREIIGMRHRLVHEYFRIVPEKVWEIARKEIPALIPLIEPLVPPDEPEADGDN